MRALVCDLPAEVRNIEEMTVERAVLVDRSWAMVEPNEKIGGQWKYLYRAVERDATRSTSFYVPSKIRLRRGHASSAPVEVPEQPHRARPSRHQTRHAAHARIQELSLRRSLISGVERMHIIRKGQLGYIKDQASSAANQFYALAF